MQSKRCIPPTNASHHLHVRPRSCGHISLNIVYYAAFFVKKVGTKKAFRGITPRSLPPYTVKNLPSSHSLLLCHHLKWGAVAKEMLVHRSQLRDRPCGFYPTFELHAVACGVPCVCLSHRERMEKRTPRTFSTDAYKTFVQISLLLREKGDYFTIVKWWMRSTLTLRTFPTATFCSYGHIFLIH